MGSVNTLKVERIGDKISILGFNPDVVGLTSITAKIDTANRIAQMIREQLGKDVKIILYR
jgi:hypothetical protein